jgi:hypothetical protein
MESFLFWMTAGFVATVGFASFFEWTLHRYIMHRPVRMFDYPFRKHALVHHQTFKADHTYHLINEQDKHTIPMAWWNGPAIIAVGMIPYVIGALLTGNWAVLCGAVIAASLYYGAYEYMHWCMHLPKKRQIERSGFYFRLNGHHLLHHRYMNRNFNVVFPLADLCLGTLLLRAPTHFKQAEGPAVPNVQPRQSKARLPKFAAVK